MGWRRRAAGREDKNQREIIDDHEDAGRSVQKLTGVGGGCPDLLVGGDATVRVRCACGKLAEAIVPYNWLQEIKNPETLKKHGGNPETKKRQEEWRHAWRGQQSVVESIAAARKKLAVRGNDFEIIVDGEED